LSQARWVKCHELALVASRRIVFNTFPLGVRNN
jgi:hypothetical protein